MSRAAVDSLCVFAPVRAGHEPALRDLLAGLPAGAQSPFAAVAGTHMARFVVVPHLRTKSGSPLDETAYLLFSAEFDAPRERYLDALLALPLMREVFRHCAGFKDDGGPAALRRYLQEYGLVPGFSVVAYPDASLEDILTGLELRRELVAFALRNRGAEPAKLQREWLATFGRRA